MSQRTLALQILALSIAQLALFSAIEAKKKTSNCEFAIVMPSYNNEKYYEENLNSVCWQNSTNPYHIYYINDYSTDSTGKLVAEFIEKNGLEEKVTLINNEVNIGGGANIYNTIHKYIEDHKIVVLLDGDDLFVDNDVLLTLEKYYKDPDLWITYGRFQAFPEEDFGGTKIPDWVLEKNQLRTTRIRAVATHLRTFKAGLFKKIKKEHFYYKGEFMRVAWDLAFMFPMLEMASPRNSKGKNHSLFIEKILYLYRYNNPLSDFRIREALQLEVDNYIRSLEPYQSIEELIV